MDSLSCEALAAYLIRQGLDADLANRLKDEKVDGKKFLCVEADLLRACGFAVGEISDILQIRKQPYQEDKSIGSTGNAGGLDNDGDKVDADDELCDEILGPYLSEFELSDISSYEKQSMCCQLKRYQTSLSFDNVNSQLCKPPFVVQWEQKEKKIRERRELRFQIASEPEKPTRSSQRLSSQNTKAGSGCSSSMSNYAEASGSSSCNQQPDLASNRVSKESFIPRKPLRSLPVNHNSINVAQDAEGDGLGHFQIRPTFGSSVVSRPSFAKATADPPQPSRQSTSRENDPFSEPFSEEDSDDNDDEAERQPDIDYDSPPFDLTVEREMTPDLVKVSSLDPHLPSYDIFKICNDIFAKGNDATKEIILKLKSDSGLSKLERKRFMRVLALHLYHALSSAPNLVTPSMKEGLAKSFVLAFPSYIVNSGDGRKPWGLIFNRNGTGFLANASRAPQRKFQSKRKKTSKNVGQQEERPDKEHDSDYAKELALIMPDRVNKTEILNAMCNTFTLRKADRKRQITITDMILKYPHFTSYSGEVLREEFKRMEPEAKDGFREYMKLLPQMLQLPAKRPISLQCNDDALKALLLISQHLPHDVVRTVRSASFAQIETLAAILKVGDDIDAYVEANAAEGKPVQPYLILIKALVGKRIIRTFLVLDRKTMQLTNSCSNALDALFKSYFVFNVQYPDGWCNTLHFLATCFYNVFEKDRKRPDCIAPNEHELFVKLGGTF